MPGDEDQLRVPAVGSDVLHHPRGRRRGILHTVGDLHAREEAVIHAHDGEPLFAQSLRDFTTPSRQAAAVKPHDGREALRIRRVINVEPAERVGIAVARGIAVGDIFLRPVSIRPGRDSRAEQGQRKKKQQKSFHKRSRFWVIKVGKIPQKALSLRNRPHQNSRKL